jgi:hypothetical protein
MQINIEGCRDPVHGLSATPQESANVSYGVGNHLRRPSVSGSFTSRPYHTIVAQLVIDGIRTSKTWTRNARIRYRARLLSRQSARSNVKRFA